VARIVAKLRTMLERFYSEIGRPSIDPELLIRMLVDMHGGQEPPIFLRA
jgi:hypothetical protein